MEMRFRVFLREHLDGRVTAKALGTYGIAATASTRERALAGVEAQLKAHLDKVGPTRWGQFEFAETQELHPIEVVLRPAGTVPQEPIRMTVNILVTTEVRPRDIRYLVVAPRVPGLHLVVADEDQIVEKARAALITLTEKWDSRAIVQIDLQGQETLETITLNLPEPDETLSQEAQKLENTVKQESVLELCGVCLSNPASAGQISRAYQRDALMQRIITTLAGPGRASILLAGPGGVGKSALVNEVAARINSGSVPPSLQNRQVWFVTANNLIAGMKYTGEWEGRTQNLIAQARAGRQILFMDDPSQILDAGRWSESDNNMGRFLRPYIESGELTVICACTAEAFAACVRQEPSFIHAFHRIDVPETNEADTLAMLQAVAAARPAERAEALTIEPPAFAAIVELTRRFMPYSAFPGKAVGLLDDVIRAVTSAPSGAQQTEHVIRRAEVIATFSRDTGLPAFLLDDEQPLPIEQVHTYFAERLLGQPEAVQAMVDLITVVKAGLYDSHKPLGSFFFVGPTGVGKTELAKVLAEFLFGSRDRMLRFDLGEYSTQDAVSRLIGMTWASEKEGELTRRVRAQPFCVVLLDELEKAHHDVFDVLLGVLGEGRLTNAAGETTDFRSAIIIMTSNLGAKRRESEALGFSRPGTSENEAGALVEAHFVKEAERFFRPEFFNRIDRIVAFRPLSLEAIRLITRRELGKLLMREGIVRRKLLVDIDDAVIEKLLTAGFSPLYGARPLQRTIERTIILPLARLLVSQATDHQQLIHFGVRDDQVHLRLVPLETEDVAGAEAESARSRVQAPLAGNLVDVLRVLEDVSERIRAEEVAPFVQSLRDEVSSLITRTHAPTFWNDQAEARAILSRIYHLERILDRLNQVSERATHLNERGRQIRLRRDQPAVPLLARDVLSLAETLASLEVDLAAARAGTGRDEAVIAVRPLGLDAQGWAEELLAMYQAWARCKEYECQNLEPIPVVVGFPGTDAPLREPRLAVKGNNIYEILRGESGLHRLGAETGTGRERALARVSVTATWGGEADSTPKDLPASPTLDRIDPIDGTLEIYDGAAIVRTYHRGRHRFVRDPRTGVRVADVTGVLRDGLIDPFLLAALRQLPPRKEATLV